MSTPITILERDSLPRGGFAGLKETRLIRDHRINGDNSNWEGLGNFVYLADATYLPFGETGNHPHREIDIITIMLEGRLTHEGSLEHGRSLVANEAQVQRAGGEGFEHNEINPDQGGSRLLQIWALPETSGEAAAYKFYPPISNQLVRIYGGEQHQTTTFDSHTNIEFGQLQKGKHHEYKGEYLAYICNGEALLNNQIVKDGDLIRGNHLNFKVISEHLQLTLITLNS